MPYGGALRSGSWGWRGDSRVPNGRPEAILFLGSAFPPRQFPRKQMHLFADGELAREPLSVGALLSAVANLRDPDARALIPRVLLLPVT
eukprot:3427818-Pyramimonas_sp.AAC.1